MHYLDPTKYTFSNSTIANIEKAISSARLNRYLTESGGDLKRALALHSWNSALGASLHLPIQTFELLLRNKMHDSLTATFASGGNEWYDVRFGDLDLKGQSQISAAQDFLRKQGRPVIAPSVVAQLTLGFWLALLTKRCETQFWVPSLHGIFPNAPRPVRRQDMFNAVDKVRSLRNRIAHHEPIYTRNLVAELAHIITVSDWMCADTAQWVKQFGTDLTDVLNARP